MFEELSGRFESLFKKLRGQGKLTEDNVAEASREVKRALLEADVNFKVVKKFVTNVQEKALGSEVMTSISPGQLFVKIVYDELCSLMGGQAKNFLFHNNRVNTVVMAGLQGSGKTTACAKLALYFRKQGLKPLLVACDTYRPAAIDQLETLGKSLGIPVYADRNAKPRQIVTDALKYAKNEDFSFVIIDTAGRLHVDTEMMAELADIVKIAAPEEIFFVADAMTGQDAVNVATEFHKAVGFTGVILTKMDGDARGGAALSIYGVTKKPIKYIGVGEKSDALEEFHPDRMASRILGMGDIVSLVEKAQEVVDIEGSKELNRKIRKNAFDLQDFLEQLRQIKKMGSIKDLLGMIPGMGNALGDTEVDPKAFSRLEAIISSMTMKERQKPMILDGSRRKRIAMGSGTSVQEVNRLIKQFDGMKDMMKKMNKMAGKKGGMSALKGMMPF